MKGKSMKKGILIFGMKDGDLAGRVAEALYPVLAKDGAAELTFVPDEDCAKTIGELSGDPFAMPEPQAPLWEEIADPFEGKVLADPKKAAAMANPFKKNGEQEQKEQGGSSDPSAGPASPVPPEPVMVFVRLSDGMLDEALAAMREAGIRIPHKAVLTPYNVKWTAWQLYAQEEARKAVGREAD